MTNAREIIVRPLVTEKTIKSQEATNTVVFEVAKDANKIAVKQAIEEIFKVKVKKVNVISCPTKEKRMGKYGSIHFTTKAIKKAYITLAEGSKIEILAEK